MRFIFDLDHTLIDSSHRQLTRPDGSLDLAHWRENCTYEMVMRDRLLPLAEQARDLLYRDNCEVMACTARVMGRADYEYLRSVGLVFDEILSRPSTCDLPDARLKEMLLRATAYERGESFYRFARRSIMIDDNLSVLDHLRGFGFRCYNAISINAALAA